MKGDDSEIGIAQTPKRLNGRLALLEKIQKTFTDSIRNKPAKDRGRHFLSSFKAGLANMNSGEIEETSKKRKRPSVFKS